MKFSEEAWLFKLLHNILDYKMLNISKEKNFLVLKPLSELTAQIYPALPH